MDTTIAKKIRSGAGRLAWTPCRLALVADGGLGRLDGALGERCVR